MKFDINKVIIKDLSGKVLKVDTPLDKGIGDFLYTNTGTLDWLEKAKAIHAGKAVELTDIEAKTLVALLQEPSCTFNNAIKEAIILNLQTK